MALTIEQPCLTEYRFGNLLGSGTYGEVYEGLQVHSGKWVAMKVESATVENAVLGHEAGVYTVVGGLRGVPSPVQYIKTGAHNVLVLPLLGPHLGQVTAACGGFLGLKTVITVAMQVLNSLEDIHSRGIVHRDIKPENILVGSRGVLSSRMSLVDFGLASQWLNLITGKIEHLSLTEGFTGTLRYASIHAHLGDAAGPRDDMESLGYTMIYLLRGSLPWDFMEASKAKKSAEVWRVKMDWPPSRLCEGLPFEFGQYMKYVRRMPSDGFPDYKAIRNLFKTLFYAAGYANDGCMDWMEQKKDDVC